MKELVVLIIIIVTLSSCNGQNAVEVTIHNRTSQAIDSVVFPYNKQHTSYKKITINKSETIRVSEKSDNLKYEGVLPVCIYLGSKQINASFGFHDYGVFASSNDNIYVYDNGITYNGKEIERPFDISIYVKKMGNVSLDSVLLPYKELSRGIHKKDMIVIKARFIDMEQNPFIYIKEKGKQLKVNFTYDWSNWNANHIILYLYDNGKLLNEAEALKLDSINKK